MMLPHEDCSVNGQWTPSHKGRPENKQADKLAEQEQTEPIRMNASSASLLWLRLESTNRMMETWSE